MEKKTSGVTLAMLRGFTALLLGIILVFWSQSAVRYLIVAVGCLFLVPGVLSLLSHYRQVSPDGHRRFGWPQVLGVGSILFGLSLIIRPVFFETTLMYVLGIILTYAGLSEIIQLVSARQWIRVPGGFYITPVLVMLVGIFILFNPIASANVPFIILGFGCMVYGVSDMVNVIKFRRRNNDAMDAVVVGEKVLQEASDPDEKNCAEE